MQSRLNLIRLYALSLSRFFNMEPLVNAAPIVNEQMQIKMLRESVSRHNQLIQSLAAAVCVCDKDGYIKFYNNAAIKLWGRVPEIGKDLWCGSWKIFTPEGLPMAFDDCPMAKTLREGRSIRGEEILIERPDGARLNIMSHPDPIFDASGNVVEGVNMLVDITDLKKKESALRESELQVRQIALVLEKRVEARTEELLEANAALKHSNQELEQFAFVASHDLQEPLRKIKTFSQKLENKSKDLLDFDATVYIDKIKDSCSRMEGLIKDVLTYSRLTYLDKKLVRTDLTEILKNVLNDFEISTEEKEATITIDPLPTIMASPLQMNQLFHNLISNSLKFTNNDVPCRIDIKSRVLSKEEAIAKGLMINRSYCEIIVADNGIGFRQEFASSIFKIFERLNTRHRYEGSGIGLALCRKIVENHSGKIFVTSQENIGTTFYIILPVGIEEF